MTEQRKLVVSAPVTLERAEGDGGAGARRFKMRAYSGDVVEQYGCRFVIDLSTLTYDATHLPIMRQHRHDLWIGRAERVAAGKALDIEGVLFAGVQQADEVAAISDQGARWQASVGIDFSWEDVATIGPKDSSEVNGRKLKGPLEILRHSRLVEASFVPLGADGRTAAAVLDTSGRLTADNTKEAPMAGRDTGTGAGASSSPEFEAEHKRLAAQETERRTAIRKEFADDPSYALDAIAEGKTLLEAQAGYTRILRERAQKAEAEAAAERKRLEAELEASRRGSPAGALGGAIAGDGAQTEAFEARVERHLSRLLERRRDTAPHALKAEAVCLAMQEDPEGHARFVREQGQRIANARAAARRN
ncbi:MAG: hypothetical protein M9894_16125 [Planctomycetes bacterium]|nr:hypothetical protein [Planctomycetota bacterium]